MTDLERRIHALAAGLNLADADDRATLRQRVSDLFKSAKLFVIHAALETMRVQARPRTRDESLRRLTDAFISRQRA